MAPDSELKIARPYLAGLAAAGLTTGVAVSLAGHGDWARLIWTAATLPVLAALLIEIVTSLRRGDVGLDIVAALSMTAALAFGESLAASIVALMYGGGQYLESFAEKAARREMTALLSRVPRTAVRHRDGQLEEVLLELLRPGDRLLIRRGDVVPVDGTVAAGVGILDQSALTGESMPVKVPCGEAAMSGSTNVGEAFDLTATRRAAEAPMPGSYVWSRQPSVREPPMSRMADRYALVFLMVTITPGRGRLGADGRSDSCRRRSRGGDAVPADSGGTGRDCFRPFTRGQARHPHWGAARRSRHWRASGRS